MILLWSHSQLGLVSFVCKDTDLMHLNDPVIINPTTQVSLRYYLGYWHVRRIWCTDGYIHSSGYWPLLCGMLMWSTSIVLLLWHSHPRLVTYIKWDTNMLYYPTGEIYAHPRLVTRVGW